LTVPAKCRYLFTIRHVTSRRLNSSPHRRDSLKYRNMNLHQTETSSGK